MVIASSIALPLQQFVLYLPFLGKYAEVSGKGGGGGDGGGGGGGGGRGGGEVEGEWEGFFSNRSVISVDANKHCTRGILLTRHPASHNPSPLSPCLYACISTTRSKPCRIPTTTSRSRCLPLI